MTTAISTNNLFFQSAAALSARRESEAEMTDKSKIDELVLKIDEFMNSSGESMTVECSGDKARIKTGCKSCAAETDSLFDDNKKQND